MNFVSWILGFMGIVLLLTQAVAFHKATVCRQKAWLKSTELRTRALLSSSHDREKGLVPSCKIILLRTKDQISWQKLPTPKTHLFNLKLTGQL